MAPVLVQILLGGSAHDALTYSPAVARRLHVESQVGCCIFKVHHGRRNKLWMLPTEVWSGLQTAHILLYTSVFPGAWHEGPHKVGGWCSWADLNGCVAPAALQQRCTCQNRLLSWYLQASSTSEKERVPHPTGVPALIYSQFKPVFLSSMDMRVGTTMEP